MIIRSLLFIVGLTSASLAAEAKLALDLGNHVSLNLILVKPGTFTQGSPTTEPDRQGDELSHRTTLAQPFYLGETEVTKGHFAQFVKETGFRTEAEDGKSGGFGWDGKQLVQRTEFTWKNLGFPQQDQDPVGCVTWFDAHAFCRWLSERTGRDFTLPSEAQWEYAARSGNEAARPVALPEEIAWFKANAQGRTQPVGGKPANAWGFRDMLGNQWEWCEDWYAPYADAAATDPLQTDQTLSDKPRRVLRGGAWTKDAKVARHAARFRNDPRSRNADNGFRVLTTTMEPKPILEAPSQPASKIKTGNTSCLLVIFAPLLAIFGIFKRLLGGSVSSGLSFQNRPTEAVTPTADGFWLNLAHNAGSRIRWSCEVNGSPLDGFVEYEPGPQGHFVFTGGPPYNVQIQLIGVAAALGSYQSTSARIVTHSHHQTSLPPRVDDTPPQDIQFDSDPIPSISIDPIPDEPPAREEAAPEPVFPSRSEPSAY